MLRSDEPVVFFVPDLVTAGEWYRVVLAAEPDTSLERCMTFRLGTALDLMLVGSEGERKPRAAVLLCDDLDDMLAIWQEWAGIVELEWLGRNWPARIIVLRDPGDNCLIVLDRYLAERVTGGVDT